MNQDALFDLEENKVLLAVCTRRLIRNIGMGSVVWGVLNIGIGMVAIQQTLLNVGILLLGLIMLGAGILALTRPTLDALLKETIVAALLFLWNLSMFIINIRAGASDDPRGIVFPLIILVVIFRQYRKLGHLRELIASIPPQTIQATKQMCKTMLKKKLKNEPGILQTVGGKCRAQLSGDRAFVIQRDQLRAFVADRDTVRSAIAQPQKSKWTMEFHHPLGKLIYRFDKDNTAKIRAWLATGDAPSIPGTP